MTSGRLVSCDQMSLHEKGVSYGKEITAVPLTPDKH